MNFAPYQDDSPETTRALSPSPRPSSTANRRPFSPPPAPASPRKDPQHGTQPWPSLNGGADERLPAPEDFENNIGTYSDQPGAEGAQGQGAQPSAFGNRLGADERNVNVFGTTLKMRLDIEACLAYVLLPPAGGALLLLLEHESDYVRFHAWQSSLLFTFTFLIHLIFSFSPVISYILLVVDLVMVAWLTLHAYKDAETLDRCEVPVFGRLASSFVDDE